MTPVTEAEIREAVAARIRRNFGNLTEMLDNALDPIVDSDMARGRAVWDPDFHPRKDHPGTLWMDLTGDEADDLSAPVDQAINSELFDVLAQIVTDRVVAAALAFAEAHPDLPRGRWQAREAVPA